MVLSLSLFLQTDRHSGAQYGEDLSILKKRKKVEGRVLIRKKPVLTLWTDSGEEEEGCHPTGPQEDRWHFVGPEEGERILQGVETH